MGHVPLPAPLLQNLTVRPTRLERLIYQISDSMRDIHYTIVAVFHNDEENEKRFNKRKIVMSRHNSENLKP